MGNMGSSGEPDRLLSGHGVGSRSILHMSNWRAMDLTRGRVSKMGDTYRENQ